MRSQSRSCPQKSHYLKVIKVIDKGFAVFIGLCVKFYVIKKVAIAVG